MNMDMVSTFASIDATIMTTKTQNTIVPNESNNEQTIRDTSSTASAISIDQEKNSSEQQNPDAQDLTVVYNKIILSNSMVLSKSDICIKLKHVIETSQLRDNIITTLLDDKLLIKGNFFAMKKVNNGVSLMPGYLKGFPKDNVQDQQEFARVLAKYGIHFYEYEQSFKKRKVDAFPRTLTATDIKHKAWLFSTELADIIQKNSFLQQRVVLDSPAIVKQTNVPLTNNKRHRKPQQRYSPSKKKD